MAERYTTIYKLDGMRYAEASPILISAGALLFDSLSRSLLVQLKCTNLDSRVIRSMGVKIHTFGSSGAESSDPVEYTYEDLNCERDCSFGKNTAVVIPDSSAHSFSVQVVSVTFQNGEVWDGSGMEFESLAAPQTLEEAVEDKDVAHQFRISYGNDCAYMLSEDKDLWFCTCGAINRETEAKCHCCHRVYSALKAVNIASLRSECRQRMESEKKYEDEEDEEISEKRGRLKKLLLIIVPAVLIVIIAVALLAGNLSRKNAFSRAEELLSAGMYDEAEAAFRQLGDYNNSAELALCEVPYQKALYVMRCAENDDTDALVMLEMKRSELPEDETVGTALYRKAAEIFSGLGEYKDSSELAAKSEKAISDIKLSILEERYLAAIALLNEKKYCEARDAFKALGEYKDSAAMADESIYTMASSLSALSEKYRIEDVFCKLPLAAGEKSVFYISQEALKSLSGLPSDIRSVFPSTMVEIRFETVPEGGDFLSYADALSALFASLGDYRDSSRNVETVEETEAPSKPTVSETVVDNGVFFEYCASGNLVSAYQWLIDHQNEFESSDMWLNILNLYIPFCGTWTFDQGDPVLISSTINVTLPCNTFRSDVRISKDGSAKLCIYPEGNADYLFQLNSEFANDGSIRFTVSPDGIHLYYAVINNIGAFNYSKYNIYAQKQKNDSCSYVKQ